MVFLEIKLIEGRGIKPLNGKDTRTFYPLTFRYIDHELIESYDIICEFKVLQQNQTAANSKTIKGIKSSISKRTNNPQWNENLSIYCAENAKETLYLWVWNRNRLLGDLSPLYVR